MEAQLVYYTHTHIYTHHTNSQKLREFIPRSHAVKEMLKISENFNIETEEPFWAQSPVCYTHHTNLNLVLPTLVFRLGLLYLITFHLLSYAKHIFPITQLFLYVQKARLNFLLRKFFSTKLSKLNNKIYPMFWGYLWLWK